MKLITCKQVLFSRTGFTLIETVIVLAVVAILSTLAFPTFTDYIQRSRRAEAQGALLELAQYMEKQFINNGSYLQADGSQPKLPFYQSPKSGSAQYRIEFKSIGSTAYEIQAIAINSTDHCSPLSIDQAGNQLPATPGCWLK